MTFQTIKERESLRHFQSAVFDASGECLEAVNVSDGIRPRNIPSASQAQLLRTSLRLLNFKVNFMQVLAKSAAETSLP